MVAHRETVNEVINHDKHGKLVNMFKMLNTVNIVNNSNTVKHRVVEHAKLVSMVNIVLNM